jgi:Nitroreductase family
MTQLRSGNPNAGARAEQATRGATITAREARALVGAAGAAPSVFNTQPWSFAVHEATIDMFADTSRELHDSVDPDGRQLAISCGAALLNLRVAAAHLGRASTVRLFPDPEEATLLAAVTLNEYDALAHPDAALYPAIRRRHTHRRSFQSRAVPGATLAELAACALTEHAALTILGSEERRWLFDLVSFSELALAEQPGYDQAMAQWTAGSSTRFDGIPATAFGSLPSGGQPPMRDFAQGHPHLHAERERFSRDPVIAILSTTRDDRVSWLQAGQGLQRLLLVACARGLAASFLNQPLDVPEIRRDMKHPLWHGIPQMIIRLGYARRDVSTPRRPVSELGRPRPDQFD